MYLPIAIVFFIILVAMWLVYPQLKGATGSKDVARVKEKVLRVSGWYFGSFLIYFVMLLICYAVGLSVHTCPYAAPYCLSWTGWDCLNRRPSRVNFDSQEAFLFLFSARGIIDFIVFFVFSFRKLMLRLKDKEYAGDDQERHQKLELHDAYRKEIMNMIQIGISRSAIETLRLLDRKQTKDDTVDLVDADFTAIEDVDVSSDGDTVVRIEVEASNASRCPCIAPTKALIRFQALAPKVFESIRRSASISAADYAETMNPTRSGLADEAFNIEESQANVLIEKLSEGKGGAFFYFSQNYKFVIKTISDGEFDFMSSILKKMWKQMVRPDTILSRYFGVYTFLYQGADIKIVVMENVSYMYPRLPIHRKYDLKGSWVARKMTKSNEPQTLPTVADKRTLKDMDMCYSVAVPSQTRLNLIQAIQKDVDFLAEAGIMDYSLFLSFHIKSASDSLGSERLDLSEAKQARASSSSTRERSSSANQAFRGMFREHHGGVFVHLNHAEPIEFLRRPDGRPVQKREEGSSIGKRSHSKDSFPLVNLSDDESSVAQSKMDGNAAGNARSKNHVQAQVICCS